MDFFFVSNFVDLSSVGIYFINGYSIFLISFIVIFSFSFSLHILPYCSVDECGGNPFPFSSFFLVPETWHG